MAGEYPLGAVAQLGERVTGSHEVRGSSPLSSIAQCRSAPAYGVADSIARAGTSPQSCSRR
jgi:hypothetical protein